MIQEIFIIGAPGNVGSTLVTQIFKEGDTNTELHSNPTRIVGLASSSNFLYSPMGISEQDARRFIGRDFSDAIPYSDLRGIIEAAEIGFRRQSSLVFVDATAAGEEMTKFHLNVIKHTPYGMITANKNPVASSDYETFQILTANPKRYGYRCSVMAGADAVPFLRDAIDLNDGVHRIEGCLSGTNMYLVSQAQGRRLSEVVREALGKYTEPDPRDDLSGFDVARKLVVLARTAGFNVGLADVALKSFIPQEYFRDESIWDFLKRLECHDSHFAELVNSARENGNVLRYVATMNVEQNQPILEVSLKEVPLESKLGMLEGRTNKVLITTNYYTKDNPYVVEGPGAGLDVTARNIRRELLEMLPERMSINGRAGQ